MIYAFTTERGIDMVARLVFEGDKYGRDGCLISDQAMIEFYRVCGGTKHNLWLSEMYGLEHDLYFISRYNLDTFLFGFMGNSPLDRGLCLEGSARQYDLTGQECRQVAAHLFMYLAGGRDEPAKIQSD